jgi:cytochrome P450
LHTNTDLFDPTTFDPFDEQVQAEPYPYYRALREHSPCPHLDRYDIWLVPRYVDAARVLHNWETFSSTSGAALEPVATPEEGGVILSTDPPEHTRIRRAVSHDFTPKMVGALEPRIRALVDEALDRALVEDQVDWVSLVAQPVPTIVMAELMGYPERHRDRYCHWASVVFDSMGCPAGAADMTPFIAATTELFGFVGELAAERQYQEDGWADRIVAAGNRGELTEPEVHSLLGGILVAAMDTTVNMLGNLAHSLAEHPDQWAILRDDPTLAPSAVNESLRYESPVQPGFFRITTEETEIGGVRLPEGARVMVAFGSANRDGDEFPEPDRFLVTRTPNNHLAFGRGTHFCLGAPVARLIGKVVVEALCERAVELSLAGDPVRKANRMLRGFDSLPLSIVGRA